MTRFAYAIDCRGKISVPGSYATLGWVKEFFLMDQGAMLSLLLLWIMLPNTVVCRSAIKLVTPYL